MKTSKYQAFALVVLLSTASAVTHAGPFDWFWGRWWPQPQRPPQPTWQNDMNQEHVLTAQFVSGELTCPGVTYEVKVTSTLTSERSFTTSGLPHDSLPSLPFGPEGSNTGSTDDHEALWNDIMRTESWPEDTEISFRLERCNISPNCGAQRFQVIGTATPNELIFYDDGSVAAHAIIETTNVVPRGGENFTTPGDTYWVTLTIDPGGTEVEFENFSVQSSKRENAWSATHVSGTPFSGITGTAEVCLGDPNQPCSVIEADPALSTTLESLTTKYTTTKQ